MRRACPRHLVLFGRALKRWLYSKRGAFDIMPRGYASWVAGGCWILARSLHEWIGPSSEVRTIRSWADSEYFTGKMPQHVVVKVGHCYLDGDGASTEDQLLHRWATQERLEDPEIEPEPPDIGELETSGIECPAGPVHDMVDALYRKFGPGERVAEAAHDPE